MPAGAAQNPPPRDNAVQLSHRLARRVMHLEANQRYLQGLRLASNTELKTSLTEAVAQARASADTVLRLRQALAAQGAELMRLRHEVDRLHQQERQDSSEAPPLPQLGEDGA